MSDWVLVLDAPVAPAGAAFAARPLLGVAPVLRLALCAQAAGANAVVVARDASFRAALADARLRISVTSPDDRTTAQIPTVHVPANMVVHRSLFAAIRDAGFPGTLTPPTFAPPFGFAPVLVEDRASARAAERALLRALRKPQDGWTSTYLNRHLSLALTRWLVRTPLSPNQTSVGILAIGLAGAYLASRGTYASMLLGAVLFQTQSVLDGCDGEMSRVTFRGSHLGEWLDTVGDDLTNYGFFAGCAWGLYASTGQALYLACGALTVACGLIGSGLEYRYLISIGSGDLLKYPLGVGSAPKVGAAEGDGTTRPPSIGARVADAIAPLFKRDTFVLLTLLGAALGLLGPFLAIFAAGAVGVLIAVVRAELRMSRARVTRAC